MMPITLPCGTKRYFLGEYFIDKPSNHAHKQATGIPHGYNYALFRSGASPKGFALRVGVFRTLKEAKNAIA